MTSLSRAGLAAHPTPSRRRFLVVAAVLAVGLAALASFFSGPVSAHGYKAGALKIGHPWSRATPANAPVAGGFMTIENTGETDDRLVAVSAEISPRGEIHEMKMEGDVMKMSPLPEGLVIKAGETVKLAPGGYHLMFMPLQRQLREGEAFKGELVFEKAGKVAVEFKVEGIGARGDGKTDAHKSHTTHGGAAP